MLLCEVGLRYEARGLARKQNAGLLVGSPTCLPASRVLLRLPAEAAASQKWKIIYLQVLIIVVPNENIWIAWTTSRSESKKNTC